MERAIQESDGALLAVSSTLLYMLVMLVSQGLTCKTSCMYNIIWDLYLWNYSIQYFHAQELVSFRHPHVRNPRLQDDYESKCQMYLESPYDEMVAAHIGYISSYLRNDYVFIYMYMYI